MATEFVKGRPFFSDVQPKLNQFPYLDRDISCDVLIVGGGITGAITAYYLCCAGVNTALVDASRIGHLSTAAATALLEYQLDDDAATLIKTVSDKHVIECYKAGLDSLKEIGTIVEKLGNKCEYAPCDTLIYSQNKNDLKSLTAEANFRNLHEIATTVLTEENNPFSFNLKAGLFCEKGGAQLNPYLFTKQLIEDAASKKCAVFENTKVVEVNYLKDAVQAVSSYGETITCKYIVCATGYNTAVFGDIKLCDKFVTYSLATNVLKNPPFHHTIAAGQLVALSLY